MNNQKQLQKRKWGIERNGIFLPRYMLSMVLFALPVVAEEAVCKPMISGSALPEEDFIQLECDISTCTGVSKVMFEKTDVVSYMEWTTVYEGISKTNYKAKDTGTEYTLENRSYYTAFRTYHLLYIQPVWFDDTGSWRCIVYEDSGAKYTSASTLEIDIYGPALISHPKKDMIIRANEDLPFTLDCTGSGYKPYIIWNKDGDDVEANDRRYIIQHTCNQSMCLSDLTVSPVDTVEACQHIMQYTGVYTCMISLGVPYKSTKISPIMNVLYPNSTSCMTDYNTSEHIMMVVGLVVGAIFGVMFIVQTILVCLRKHKDKGDITWPAAESEVPIASGVTPGSSFSTSLAAPVESRVVCTIEIQNWTKHTLTSPGASKNGGEITRLPIVKPGTKERFIAHAIPNSFTGTYGTVSWMIESQNRRAVVMWSCPYNFYFYSNWLGIGLTDPGITDHTDWFDQMYSGSSGSGLTFFRLKYFYTEDRPILVKDDRFQVKGIMGRSQSTNVKIIIRPLNDLELASNLKQVDQKTKKK